MRVWTDRLLTEQMLEICVDSIYGYVGCAVQNCDNESDGLNVNKTGNIILQFILLLSLEETVQTNTNSYHKSWER